MKCRVLQKQKCEITQFYSNNHPALDIVGENYTLDNIIAHSEGKVIEIKDGISNLKGSIGNLSYGNYVTIEHSNGYRTLYAHMQSGLEIKKNQSVKKGQIIGFMGDSGNAYGKHLHFEVWKDNQRINPIEFLDKDFPSKNESNDIELKYKIGDIVEINGVYVSSNSKEKLRPLITRGKITKVVPNTNNPYLLEAGKIGWVKDDVILSKQEFEYLSNVTYNGTSIVDALKEINVDSSYQYRSELAKTNNIQNYQGNQDQNIKLLSLLKQGLLKVPK